MTFNPLDIKNEMAAFDRKDRNYYDNFTDEEKKKFSNYLMLRWGSSISGSSDFQAYYLMSTNENLNKNFFDINKHPKLQWLCSTTVSPGMGKQYHNWISTKKESNKIYKFVEKHFPDLKADEIETFIAINDINELKQMARDLGYDLKDIKKELG